MSVPEIPGRARRHAIADRTTANTAPTAVGVKFGSARTTLVFDGLLEEHPRLKLIFNHLGGSIPFLADRLERGYRFPEVRKTIPKPPMEYFKRLYWDTVSFYPPAVECAHAFAGADHLVLGSDYPFLSGDLGRAVSSIEETALSPEDKDKILGGTARGLLGL